MRLIPGRRTAAGAVLAGVLLALPTVPASAGVARAAVEGPDCLSLRSDSDERTVKGPNTANETLQVPRAQELARARGAGVTVIVVDSTDQSAHGTAVGGIVVGRDQTAPTEVGVGIAPEAGLQSRPFYDVPAGNGGGDNGREPSSSALAGVLDGIHPGKRTIVLVPTQVARSAALENALDRLTRAGALVVAAAGDRPAEGVFPDQLATRKAGEDAAGVIWPAAHPGVLSVSASDPGAWDQGTVLRNSGVDLAAPGADTVSIGLNGGHCALTQASSAWAAAEVAGVAALVWSAFPTDDAARLTTRLEQTASGNGGPTSPRIGYGVVQPVEALQRRLDAMSRPRAEPPVPAQAPRPAADVLATTRSRAVWWGLGGGAALVVLVVLRPLLARRR
ncbi:hypothetical protein GCM10022237_22750 [Nocardioides ginsengisoli]|uniref:S8 family serine peptidase n=1 Tax=Nocardioides ginsengisoli TaxID=363868 RepID=A0ABW3W132_9ACTN